jgi:hypothetical protein
MERCRAAMAAIRGDRERAAEHLAQARAAMAAQAIADIDAFARLLCPWPA